MARALLRAEADETYMERRSRIQKNILREESRPLLLPQNEFRKMFRVTKEEFGKIYEELRPYLKIRNSTAIKNEIKILAALTFYGHGSYQKNVGALMHLGMCQASVSNCLQEVTEALNHPEILKKFIKFPRTRMEQEQVEQGFRIKFGFPGVLGCIDGTHVAIVRPTEREENYFNRKMYHSLNVMAICDSDLVIKYIDASFGGAAHDSHIWNCSPVKTYMERLYGDGQQFWLLGDSGYAQRPWLMQPILNAAPNSPEEHYTNVHCKTRNVIERCFGVLKTRWRCLLSQRVLYYQPIKAAKIVNACAVLHNLVLNSQNLNIDVEEIQQDRDRLPVQEPAVNDNGDNGRSAIVNSLWLNRPVNVLPGAEILQDNLNALQML